MQRGEATGLQDSNVDRKSEANADGESAGGEEAASEMPL